MTCAKTLKPLGSLVVRLYRISDRKVRSITGLMNPRELSISDRGPSYRTPRPSSWPAEAHWLQHFERPDLFSSDRSAAGGRSPTEGRRWRSERGSGPRKSVSRYLSPLRQSPTWSGRMDSVESDRAAKLAAIPAGESPANRGVQSLL
jgi:hypothetical protein